MTQRHGIQACVYPGFDVMTPIQCTYITYIIYPHVLHCHVHQTSSGFHPLKVISSEQSAPPFSVGELGGVDAWNAAGKVYELIDTKCTLCTLINCFGHCPQFPAENQNAAHSSCVQLRNWQGSRENWWQPLLQESEAEPVWAEPSNSAPNSAAKELHGWWTVEAWHADINLSTQQS